MRFSLRCWLFALVFLAPAGLAAQANPETVTVDAKAPAQAFPHFWEQMFGSGRATLTLRDSYRRDMRQVKQITDFKYVRFHAILDDDVGVYSEDKQGNPIYNFTYVDEIYDGLLAENVKPFVELSFMPKDLASRLDYQSFWYRPIVSPPGDYAKWNALIGSFAQHLIARYGIDEIATWYFEVWNEPNIDFWTGRPAQETYFELYDNTARTLKSVSSRIRVGGPATARADWVQAMIEHATKNAVPLDFVSTHVYGNDAAEDVFGPADPNRPVVPTHGMVGPAVEKVYQEVQASARPDIPIIWSEFNATYSFNHEITDSTYMGPWLANTIRQCAGKVTMISYWIFSDVYEELGVIKEPFFGGFGLIAIYDVPKPSFNVFDLLHSLGTQRLSNSADDVLVTRKKNGSLVLAAWDLVEPGVSAPAKIIRFRFKGVSSAATVRVRRVDATHGNVLAAYDQMGRPTYPTQKQLEQLRAASRLGQPESMHLHAGVLTLSIPPQGLALVEIP